MNSENSSFVPSSLGYVSTDQNLVIGRQLILLSAHMCCTRSFRGASSLCYQCPSYHKLKQITTGHLLTTVLKQYFVQL